MDEFDQAFANLRRSPFGEVDANDVFEQKVNMPSVPTSGIEDIGFTPEQLAMIRNGVYNADFRTPPPEGEGVELDNATNKLPGWTYTRSGTAVTATWEDDDAGGNVTFHVASGAGTGDSATIEQIVPVSGIGRNTTVYLVTGVFTIPDDNHIPSIEAQYLDATGTTTGTAMDTQVTNEIPTRVVVPNGEEGVPDDGYLMRIRISVTDDGPEAGTYEVQHVFVRERLTIPGETFYYTMGGDEGAFPEMPDTDWFTRSQFIAVDSPATIMGIRDDVIPDDRIIWIYNRSSTTSLVIGHNNGGADADTNKVVCPNNADMTVRPRGCVMLRYFGDDYGANLRWRVMSQI